LCSKASKDKRKEVVVGSELEFSEGELKELDREEDASPTHQEEEEALQALGKMSILPVLLLA
jgi:hypothetical protein